MASSAAESPPPMTTRGLLRKIGTAPSQTAQAEMPFCQYFSSPGRPRRRAEAPVAMMTASAVCVSSGDHSMAYLKGREEMVKLGDRLGYDLSTEALGLGAHLVHQLLAHDAVGEAGVVLDLGGGRQLAAGSDAIGEETLV